MHAIIAAALSGGTQPVLPGFLNALSSPLQHFGLWAILLLVMVEDFGIPVPGETVLIAGAVYAGSGRLNVVEVALVGFFAAIFGDNIGYAIGRFGGRALVERWGKYVFLTPERLDKAEDFFNRHGGKIITVARFIEGLRQANGIVAGLSGMRWLKFLFFNALGAALWVGTWVSVGYFAGQHITTIYHDITVYSLYVAIAAAVLIAAWVALRIRKRRARKAMAVVVEVQAAPADSGEPSAGAEAGTAGEAATPDNGTGTSRAAGQAATGTSQAAGESGTGTEAAAPAADRSGSNGQGAQASGASGGHTAIPGHGIEIEGIEVDDPEADGPAEAIKRRPGGPAT